MCPPEVHRLLLEKMFLVKQISPENVMKKKTSMLILNKSIDRVIGTLTCVKSGGEHFLRKKAAC